MSIRGGLLAYLKAHQGDWVSGQWLSEKLGVSRSALWKHMGILRRQGYGIESSPKKGYLLEMIPDILFPSEIQKGWIPKGLKDIRILPFEETDSTNQRAKELALQGAPEGTVVMAEAQTQGRGRMGRQWFSPRRQGIYCSILLRPRICPAEISGITLMTAVVVAELLRDGPKIPATIKWPNDILAGGRKIAGILTEVSAEMDQVDFAVIGLGLNVNIPKGGFPVSLRRGATSIAVEARQVHDRNLLLQAYLKKFDEYYSLFRTQGLGPILVRWKGLTDMLGKPVQVEVLGQRRTGEALDIDPHGALILRDADGQSHRILSGDVRFRKGARKETR